MCVCVRACVCVCVRTSLRCVFYSKRLCSCCHCSVFERARGELVYACLWHLCFFALRDCRERRRESDIHFQIPALNHFSIFSNASGLCMIFWMMLLGRMEKNISCGFSFFFPLLNTPIEKSGASRANFLPVESVGGTSLVAVVIHNSEIQTCGNGPCFFVLKLQSRSGFDRQI